MESSVPNNHIFYSLGAALALLVSLIFIASCSGPQPLSVAINPVDDRAYTDALQAQPSSPKEAFFAWKAKTSSQSSAEIARFDDEMSTTRNPFSARSDSDAVSRGAVIYKAHCANCHGENANGRGPAMKVALSNLDFHSFSKRFAVTLHGGAPTAWFKKISDGFTSETTAHDGSSVAMPPFKHVLAREQIWLAITYLQSLDADAPSGTH